MTDHSTFNFKTYRTIHSCLKIWFTLFYRLTYGFLSLANGYKQTDKYLSDHISWLYKYHYTLTFIKSQVDRLQQIPSCTSCQSKTSHLITKSVQWICLQTHVLYSYYNHATTSSAQHRRLCINDSLAALFSRSVQFSSVQYTFV